jgi:preprotein translocase subunit SecD
VAPPQGQQRPGRQLAFLAAIFVVLYLFVFFGAGAQGSIRERLHPSLGLDLIGGTQVTYAARTLTGAAPPRQNLEQARGIIESRVNALGVSEAEVVIEGERNIVVSKAGENNNQLREVGQPAKLGFRKVLKAVMDTGPVQAAPSAQPSGSAAPGQSAAPQAPGAPKASAPAPSASAGGQGGGAPAPSASAPAPSGSAAPAPAPAPSTSAVPGAEAPVTVEAVRKKVGEAAWKAAGALQAPATDPAQTQALAPFGKLSEQEINVLPAEMQFNVPAITCDKLNNRPAGALDNEKVKVTACEPPGYKYYLDVAKVLGTDVKTASPVLDQQRNQWVVSLDFTSEGQAKWTALTREAFTKQPADGCEQAAQVRDPSAQHCLVAVVLDREVISAPEIQGVLTGNSQITGQFTPATATDLANKLKFGALPLAFDVVASEQVSATLGTEQLQAGLIAAGIGMLLVAIYSFFYYRLLGSVIFVSLMLSGLLTFGALVVLGRGIGFTLTLAGIAGFIVSLGVAADSFVIYFERLKDEIREGRSPRSAVDRAWIRARRTIISANTITILAAVVLYIVSIGAVQGFAFALGLSTILDLVVVFLFRHPVMTMLARTKAFLSPRVSGLGRVLKQHPADADAASTSRVKEA